MSVAENIFNTLLKAENLEARVKELSDADLRTVRGALARSEFAHWSADLIHGVCILEGSRRFERSGISANTQPEVNS